MNWSFGRTAVLGATAILVTAGAACSDPEASEPRGTTSGTSTASSSAPTTSASPADVAGERAIAAYVGMWEDMVDAAKTSDWEDSNLGRHATKDALRVITGSLYADHKNGVITKGSPTYEPEVTSVKPKDDPTTVRIADCGDSTNWLKYRKKDGKRLTGTSDGKRRILAEVKMQDDGEWRVTRFAVQGVGTCG